MSDDTKLFEELIRCRKTGIPSALAILVRRSGSAPQSAGAKMLVMADGSCVGTVGGGRLEAEVIQAAQVAVGTGESVTLPIDLTEDNGYVCGGRVLVYIEPILSAPQLIIFGAGHVGKALCRSADFAGFAVTVVDDRREFADPAQLPAACRVQINSFSEPLAGIAVNQSTYVVIATRGHTHDLEVLQAVLRTRAAYIGVLGSRRKRDSFFDALRKNHFHEEDIARVNTPVGMRIGAVTPNEIAVSITAEMIQHRRTNGLSGCSPAAGSGSIQTDGPAQATTACPA